MIKRRRFPKIFFGWWTVLAGGFIAFWSVGYHIYGISALFKPIASELGFSRAETSVATAIGRLEGGFETPLTGWITDRYGPRWIVLLGVVLMSASLILMNYIGSLWAFYVVWGVLFGTGCNFASTLPIDTSISNWFVKKRGLALGIKWVLSGLGGSAVLPLIAWLISTQSWRMACVVGGVVMGLVGLPLAFFCFKSHRPEYYGLLPDGATAEEEAADSSRMIDKGVKYASEVEEVEFTLRQALRTPTYWLLIIANACHGLAFSGFLIHSIPFLTDMGVDPIQAAGILAMMVAIGIPARFAGGLVTDRVKRGRLRLLVGGAYFLQTVGFAVFLLNPTIATIYVWVILYGIGQGASFTLHVAMQGRYFGRKAFGSIRGFAVFFTVPIGVVAPIYSGWVYDTTGSYMTAFTLFTVLLAFSTVIMFLTPPPKPPAQVTDVHKFM